MHPLFVTVVSVAIGAAPDALPADPLDAVSSPTILVVVGAEGTEEFGRMFRASAERWQAAAKQAGAECALIGLDDPADETDDRQRWQQQLAAAANESAAPLWLVLIGHGTFDGKTARFNLRGPDVEASELGEWLAPLERQVVVCCCFSSSAPFLPELSAPGRVVLTATRSGYEHNLSRFGEYLSAAIADPAGDLDKDDQTSILEAFLLASARLAEFYEQEARLASEHPLLDDNGDKLGTPADWFQGVRATKSAREGAQPDGQLAVQLALVQSQREERLSTESRARRDELERQLAGLRQHKLDLTEDEYFALLEPLLVKLARLYEEAESRRAEAPE